MWTLVDVAIGRGTVSLLNLASSFQQIFDNQGENFLATKCQTGKE